MGDDKWAANKMTGLLSIVVPKYCIDGMLPLKTCGIHRFENNNFMRLSEEYINSHFDIVEDLNSVFEDLR